MSNDIDIDEVRLKQDEKFIRTTPEVMDAVRRLLKSTKGDLAVPTGDDEEATGVDPFFLGDADEALNPANFVLTEEMDSELCNIDPETQARLEALLEAAGIRQLTTADGRAYNDPVVLRRLTHTVSGALDDAAKALTQIRDDQQLTGGEPLEKGSLALPEAELKRLLDRNRNLPDSTDEGESLLSMACSAGYFELAQALIALRANIEDRTVKGDSPLMEACSGGYMEIVRLLVEHKADVNAQSAVGNTGLHYAACGGYDEVVRLLVNAGAKVEVHNENGHTPLMEAASAGHVCVAKTLLEAGAGINTHSNEFKESALTLACYKGHLDMVQFLLDAGADQEHKTDEMHTALMEAAMDGHVDVARLLLDSGAQVNMPADSFESPLTLAACGGHVDLANLLIERGANLEETNDEGYTALMEAAREGHEEMVALLVAHGAEINCQTEETQETALTLAACGGYLEVCEFLVKAGANVELGCGSPIMEAAQEGHIEVVRFLLAEGANVNAETNTRETALTFACENGHTEVAALLHKAGAKLEHQSEGGRTPLMKAARAGHLNTVKFLFERGADINATTSNGEHSVLSVACSGGHQAVVEFLLQNGANPTMKLKDGSTMLIEAAKGGHTGIVNLLLDYPNVLPDPTTMLPPPQAGEAIALPDKGQLSTVAIPWPAGESEVPMIDLMDDEGPIGTSVLDKPIEVELDLSAGGDMDIPEFREAAEIMSKMEHQLGPKTSARLEQFISNMMRKAELSATKDEQIAKRQQILEELQKVEKELQDKATAHVIQSVQQGLAQEAQTSSDGPPQPRPWPRQTGRRTGGAPKGPPLTSATSKDDESEKPSLPPPTEQAAAPEPEPTRREQDDGARKIVPNALSAVHQQIASRTARESTEIAAAKAAAASNADSTESCHVQIVKPVPLPRKVENVRSRSSSNASSTSSGNVVSSVCPLHGPSGTIETTAMHDLLNNPALTNQLKQLLTEKPDISDLKMLAEQLAHFPSSQQQPESLPQQLQQQIQLQHQLQTIQKRNKKLKEQQKHLLQQHHQLQNQCHHQHHQYDELARDSAFKPVYPDENLLDSGPCTPNPSPVSPPSPSPLIDLDAETESNHDTALTLACAGGHAELVNLLLARGSDIEHRDKKGFTPLILAATAGHVDVVGMLLDNGADLEAQSERTKDTPLSLACSGGKYEVADLLLERGANKEHRNVSDYTPLSLAASGGYVQIIKLLLSKDAEINSRTGSKLGISPLMLAAMNGHVQAVKVLLEAGADVNAQIETNKNTALTLACFQGRHEVVNLLLDFKANVEHRAKTGLSPLMEAASGGFVEVGRVLLDKGADVNAPPVPSSRDTALTIAADKGHYKFTELLIVRGAMVDAKNKKGNSPLWLACNSGHLEVVRLLVRAGADVDSQDNRKVSCLMAAFRKGHTFVVKYLVGYVSQFPSDKECTRFVTTITDGELLKKCQECMEIIVRAKDRQAVEANKNATILLELLESEKTLEEKKKQVAQKKRQKKKEKKEKRKAKQKEAETTGDQKDDAKSEAIDDETLAVEKESKGTETKMNSVDSTTEASKAARETEDKILKQQPIASTTTTIGVITSANSLPKRGKLAETKLVSATQTRMAPVESDSTESASSKEGSPDGVQGKENAKKGEAIVESRRRDAGRRGEAKQQRRDDETMGNQVKTHHKKDRRSERSNRTDMHANTPLKPHPRNNANGYNNSPRKNSRTKEEQWKEVTHKKEPVTSRVRRVMVPGTAISRVIGKAGCNINAIRDFSGAHIEVEKQSAKTKEERAVVIRGGIEAARLAQNLIMTLVNEPDRDVDEILAGRQKKEQLTTKPGGITILTSTHTTSTTRSAAVDSKIAPRHQQKRKHQPDPDMKSDIFTDVSSWDNSVAAAERIAAHQPRHQPPPKTILSRTEPTPFQVAPPVSRQLFTEKPSPGMVTAAPGQYPPWGGTTPGMPPRPLISVANMPPPQSSFAFGAPPQSGLASTYSPFESKFDLNPLLAKHDDQGKSFASVAKEGISPGAPQLPTHPVYDSAISPNYNFGTSLEARAPGYNKPQEVDQSKAPGFKIATPRSTQSAGSTPDTSPRHLESSQSSSGSGKYHEPGQPMTLPKISSELNPHAPAFQRVAGQRPEDEMAEQLLRIREQQQLFNPAAQFGTIGQARPSSFPPGQMFPQPPFARVPQHNGLPDVIPRPRSVTPEPSRPMMGGQGAPPTSTPSPHMEHREQQPQPPFNPAPGSHRSKEFPEAFGRSQQQVPPSQPLRGWPGVDPSSGLNDIPTPGDLTSLSNPFFHQQQVAQSVPVMNVNSMAQPIGQQQGHTIDLRNLMQQAQLTSDSGPRLGLVEHNANALPQPVESGWPNNLHQMNLPQWSTGDK